MSNSRERVIEMLRKQKLGGKNLVGLGILLVAIGVYLFTQARQFCATATRAPGVIVSLDVEGTGNTKTVFPVFSFKDQNGKEHVVHANRTRVWTSRWSDYQPGDKVEVLYAPGEPDKARLNSVFAVWGWPIVFWGVGTLLGTVGAILWYFAVHAPVNLLAKGKLPEE